MLYNNVIYGEHYKFFVNFVNMFLCKKQKSNRIRELLLFLLRIIPHISKDNSKGFSHS